MRRQLRDDDGTVLVLTLGLAALLLVVTAVVVNVSAVVLRPLITWSSTKRGTKMPSMSPAASQTTALLRGHARKAKTSATAPGKSTSEKS